MICLVEILFQIYLQDFLRRLKAYNIIDFDLSGASEDNEKKEAEKSKHDIDLSKQRELKLQRFQREKELKELVKNSESELCSNVDDDELMVFFKKIGKENKEVVVYCCDGRF